MSVDFAKLLRRRYRVKEGETRWFCHFSVSAHPMFCARSSEAAVFVTRTEASKVAEEIDSVSASYRCAVEMIEVVP